VLADAQLALQALADGLGDYRTQWGEAPRQARAALDAEVDRLYAVQYQTEDFESEVAGHLDSQVLRDFIEMTGSCLTQSRVLGLLNQQLPSDAVIVAAAGSLPGDLQRAWRSTSVDSYHVEYGYSCMGYEVNAALGAKMAAPEREVYALVGDGSYMMLHSELATSIQERRKINVVLLDNMAFGCINNLQMGNGMGSFGTEFRFRNPETGLLDGDFVPVDFAMSAAAYGCKTYKVKTAEELEAALIDARKQAVSTLIDIKVLPKTMIHGYLSWWRVGVAQVSTDGSTAEAYERQKTMLAKARKY
jgi:3D-(3,5/4)-trihydroxycyclohexane-1,2-dione acylhydrolase (decyclizing)